MIRRRWPEVVGTLARLRRSTWALVSQNAQVASVGGGVLRLSFTTAGLAKTFRSGPHAAPVQQALAETLGVQLRVEAVVDEGGDPGGGSPAGGGGPGGGRPVTPQPPVPSPVEMARASWNTPPDAPSAPTPNGMVGARGAQAGAVPVPAAAAAAGTATGAPSLPAAAAAVDVGRTGTATAVETPPPADDWEPGPEPDFDDGPPPEAMGAPGPVRAPEPAAGPAAPVTAASPEPPPQRVAPEDDEPSMDDPDAEGSGLVGIPLVAQVLGGTIIEDGPVGPQD